MSIFEQARRDGRVVLRGISWQTYDSYLRDPEVGHLRLTYHRGTLELCARLLDHERVRCVLDQLFLYTCVVSKTRFVGGGLTTLRREDRACGLEPDQSYFIRNWERMRGKKGELVLPHDLPDIAVEVDVIGSCLDRPGVYAALGVRELWRCDGTSLRAYLLGPDGAYEWCERSPTFPFLPLEEVARFVRRRDETSDSHLSREFEEWLKGEVVPDRVIHGP